ncbi:hypothetical protein [Bradyrhizobium jicamae]|uniref:hypothetical protein n=1 Tax=Bradyrhizobium jicamae TaxID=280332 RepID=UPI001BAD0A3D|nr:hypothetical protein [Bradyrhizobium jicamae]MBR0938222.1 hypothetical protein [Bradyrhizobium jicamae]
MARRVRSQEAAYILNARERKALGRLTEGMGRDFLIKGQFAGIGDKTLATLVELGLAETGPSKRYCGEIGWRITPRSRWFVTMRRLFSTCLSASFICSSKVGMAGSLA